MKVVRAAQGVVRGGSLFTTPAKLARVFYGRFIGLPSKRAISRFAGLQYEHFNRTVNSLERADRSSLEAYERLFIGYYDQFGAQTEIEAMERLRENSLNSDKPGDQRLFLEVINREEYAPKQPQQIGKQTNIQINDNSINQITDPEEIAKRMAELEKRLPAGLMETARRAASPVITAEVTESE